MSRSAADNHDRRERIRNQMRDFYNVESPGRGKSEGRSTSTARPAASTDADPMNLDSPAFSVERFTTQLLQQETLKGLVQKDTELRRHVRALDGELQELVYRNYSKFISATDTIRQMKDNVTDMDAKLRALSSNVETIERVSTVISTNLQVHRERIETTLNRNRNLRKVQFLVELADAMQAFMEAKKYHLAVRFWFAGDGVLTRHTHITSFERTHLECRELARKLYSLLEDLVRTTPLDSPENVDSVRQAVIDLRKLRETSLFQLQASAADSGAFDSALVDVMMASATQALRSAVNDAKTSIGRQFSLPQNLGIEQCAEREKFLQNVQLRESLNSIKTACAMYTNSWQNLVSIMGGGTLDEKELTCRMTATMQPLLVEMSEFIATTVADLSLACIRSTVVCAGTSTLDSSKEIAFSVLGAFARLVKQFTSSLKTLGANHLDTSHLRQSHQFEILVDEFARASFVGILRLCEEFADGVPSSISTGAERRTFPRIVLLAALVARTVSRVTMLDLPNSGAFDANPLRGAFSDTCRNLVHRHILLSGQLQSQMVRTALEAGNWQQKPEPIGPSGYAVALVEEWGATYATAREWFAAEMTVKHERVGSQAESHRSNGSSDAMGSTGGADSHRSARSAYSLTAAFSRRDASQSFDKMLSAKSTMPISCSPVTCDAPHIVEACIVFTLKAFLQYVRNASFNKGGFQQLQVDLSFVLRSFSAHSGTWFKREELRCVQLVNDIAMCAFERTFEKTPLIADAVEQLAKK